MINPPLIDSHVHVWDRSCTLIEGARYHPDYEAMIGTYLDILDAHSIGKAVLVQPSFLGTDNTYLLDCLRAHPDRLRGIVVLDPATTETELDDLTAAGVIGARFNLIGHAPVSIATPEATRFIRAISARNWWSEVQLEGEHWPIVLDTLNASGARIMVDHFGKPSGPDCPGHLALLNADPARICVKFSAPYRQRISDLAPYARAFLDAWGPERCLWGSDWPWTQNEGNHSYAETISWLEDWTCDAERRAMRNRADAHSGFEVIR